MFLRSFFCRASVWLRFSFSTLMPFSPRHFRRIGQQRQSFHLSLRLHSRFPRSRIRSSKFQHLPQKSSHRYFLLIRYHFHRIQLCTAWTSFLYVDGNFSHFFQNQSFQIHRQMPFSQSRMIRQNSKAVITSLHYYN